MFRWKTFLTNSTFKPFEFFINCFKVLGYIFKLSENSITYSAVKGAIRISSDIIFASSFSLIFCSIICLINRFFPFMNSFYFFRPFYFLSRFYFFRLFTFTNMLYFFRLFFFKNRCAFFKLFFMNKFYFFGLFFFITRFYFCRLFYFMNRFYFLKLFSIINRF